MQLPTHHVQRRDHRRIIGIHAFTDQSPTLHEFHNDLDAADTVSVPCAKRWLTDTVAQTVQTQQSCRRWEATRPSTRTVSLRSLQLGLRRKFTGGGKHSAAWKSQLRFRLTAHVTKCTTRPGRAPSCRYWTRKPRPGSSAISQTLGCGEGADVVIRCIWKRRWPRCWRVERLANYGPNHK
ncbi:hypothetical protein JOF57_006183 [Mycolicibacterium lutetiense]|uniref:Uncharacterized protein n=1 Tax=Mycolicibacterium lutetiense TaxID=1641992 RepID=A0ABS5A3C2_9MYCO|nr:hypothetical protein [Mycolicibacterium lutetiense]